MDKFKTMIKKIRQPLLITIVFMILCGLVFPLLLTGISAVAFPYQSKGSIVEVDGKAVGSEIVGQQFTKPYFMKGRPSAVQYNTYSVDENGNKVLSDGSEFGGVASGSNNYAPSNPELVERTENDIEKFLEENPSVKREDIPADLMTASGSGLDPHITVDAARIQVPAISVASGISEDELNTIIDNNTKGKLLGVFGETTVNVLGVNLDIAEQMGIVK